MVFHETLGERRVSCRGQVAPQQRAPRDYAARAAGQPARIPKEANRHKAPEQSSVERMPQVAQRPRIRSRRMTPPTPMNDSG